MFSLVWSETTPPPFLFTTKSNIQAVFGKCRNFESNHKISSQETGPASPMLLMEAYPMESSIRKASIARVGKLDGLGPKFRAKPLASTLDDKRNKISGGKKYTWKSSSAVKVLDFICEQGVLTLALLMEDRASFLFSFFQLCSWLLLMQFEKWLQGTGCLIAWP